MDTALLQTGDVGGWPCPLASIVRQTAERRLPTVDVNGGSSCCYTAVHRWRHARAQYIKRALFPFARWPSCVTDRARLLSLANPFLLIHHKRSDACRTYHHHRRH